MQIYALDNSGKSCHAAQAKKSLSYKCPECSSILRARRGPFRQPHFYHLQKTLCRHAGKSLIHLNMQYALQKIAPRGELLFEHHFPQIGRIADLFWPQQKLVFECQLSPISAQEVRARCTDYGKLGYTVVWILHDKTFNKSKLSPAEKTLLGRPHYFSNIDRLGLGIFYDQVSLIHFNHRIKQSRKLPVSLHKPTPIKQIARHLPPERQKRGLFFAGDAAHTPSLFTQQRSRRLSWIKRCANFYRIILHLLLEKTTS